ncbi:hypothetical protein F5Y08DRAFT_333382 [Xylaria arbuscula]|nr:hypothetical protein F5Y08DRAFT_333382 [Xylaria arbuscula]
MPRFSSRQGPAPSKFLEEHLENELRIGVLDAVVDGLPLDESNKPPQVIIGNLNSGCHGTYRRSRHGVQFIFHHCKMKYATQCRCIVQEDINKVHDLPKELNQYRLQLIEGRNVHCRLEPKLAAMVVMKTFLGMSVPEPLQWTDSLNVCVVLELSCDESRTLDSTDNLR